PTRELLRAVDRWARLGCLTAGYPRPGGDGAVVTLVVLTTLGLAALAVGLVGLAAGRLDRMVLSTRPRLALLAVAGLGLLFAGVAPPTPVPRAAAAVPDPRPVVPVREALRQLEQAASPASGTRAVFPEQRRAFAQWEKALLGAFEQAERALDAVPPVLEGLNSGRLDRFTAWVHLGRYSQDIKQAHLALHHLRPPSVLDLEHQRALEKALYQLHYSLANQREAVVRLQRHARTWRPEELQAARERLQVGQAQRQQGLTGLVQVKAQLGLVPSSPAPASAAGPPAGR
ncbi:MAG TPA: hypothetical protein VIK93_08235, partial [Limnochordales bacterium]